MSCVDGKVGNVNLASLRWVSGGREGRDTLYRPAFWNLAKAATKLAGLTGITAEEYLQIIVS